MNLILQWWAAAMAALSDLRASVATLRTLLPNLATKHDLIEMEKRMTTAEQSNYEKLTSDLHKVADGYAALKAENDALKADNGTLKTALAEADSDKSAAVEAALTADSAADAEKYAEADAIISDLVADQPGPAPEPTPPLTGDGSGDAPAEGGGTDTGGDQS